MNLWGCELGSRFLDCAGTLYTDWERALLGAIVIAAVAAGSFLVVRVFQR